MSFSLPNPYSYVKPLTKKESALIESIEQSQQSAREHNEKMKHEKPITGKIMRYCPIDEAPLKAIKAKPV